jgi:hypothetical protein
MSNAVTIFQKGGFSTQAGRLAGIGVLSPRISPVVALFTTHPRPRRPCGPMVSRSSLRGQPSRWA